MLIGGASRARNWVILALIAAGLGLGALVGGMLEEPYHIDELRQVGYYNKSPADVISESFDQDQPPLDALTGALTQRVIGIGDIRQRLHPVLLGGASLAVLGYLLWLAGLRAGVAATLLIYGISPIVVSYTAYARPYSLPLFLMLAFVLGTALWLRDRHRWQAAIVVGTAFLLPLSRAGDPPIFLALSVAILLLYRRLGRLEGPVSLPILSATAALLLVGLPVAAILLSEVTGYGAGADPTLLDKIQRLFTDVRSRVGVSFIVPWLALAIAGLSVSIGDIRRRLASHWWIWPIALTPIGFAGLFVITVGVTQPYFERYTFFWWLPFAILFGFVVDWIVHTSPHPLTRAGVAALVLVYSVSVGVALADDLRSDAWVDYQPLASLIDSTAGPETVVVFDDVVRIGAYRAGFAGQRRYADFGISRAIHIIRNPAVVAEDASLLVALKAEPVAVDGWTRIEASDRMSLFVPMGNVAGRLEIASSLRRFAASFPAEEGAVLALAAASLLVVEDELELACELVESLVTGTPHATAAIRDITAQTPLGTALETCPGAWFAPDGT